MQDYKTNRTWNVPVGITSFRLEFVHDWTQRTARLSVDKAFFREFTNIRDGSNYQFDLQHEHGGETKRAQCDLKINLKNKDGCCYIFKINGKPYDAYKKEFSARYDVWQVVIGKRQTRIVLDKQELTVWGRGALLSSKREFDPESDGVITSFVISEAQCKILTKNEQNGGLYHELVVQEMDVPERRVHIHTDLY